MLNNKHPLQDTGFLITPYTAPYLNLSLDTQDNRVPDSIKAVLGNFDALARKNQLPEDSKYYDLTFTADNIYTEINVVYHEGFIGYCSSLYPQKTINPLNVTYCDDRLLYIPFNKTEYASENDIMAEIQTLFQTKNIKMPKSFDWWRYMVIITGQLL